MFPTYAISTSRLGADQGAINVKSTVGDSAFTPAKQEPATTKPRIAFIILGTVIIIFLV